MSNLHKKYQRSICEKVGGKASCAGLLFALIVLSQFAFSEQHKPRLTLPDQVHTYLDRSYGFSIELAKDFELVSETRDLLFFKSASRAGTVIIRPRPGLSLSNVQAALRTGFESSKIKIIPTGAPNMVDINGGQGLGMGVTGQIDGREIQGIFAGVFGGDDQGYMILVGSVRERWLGFESSANAMLESMAIVDVQPGFEYERWQGRLRGKRLIFAAGYGNYYNGGGSISEYQFCSDGTFMRRTDSTSTYSGAWRSSTYGTTSKGSGTWQVQMIDNYPHVAIRHKRGNLETPAISEEDGYIILGGVPYMLAHNELCP
ncbi:MAG: hypothetical protein VB957_12635 [Pseudomonadales bacterium]